MADDTLNVAPARPAGARARIPAGLALAAVALQIAYPLAQRGAREHLAVVIVVLLAAAALVHAAVSRGPGSAAALLLVTAVPGFFIEVLGVHTGVPFGGYGYSGQLGPRWFGVPPLVGLAWTMLAWPAALTARRLVRRPLARVIVGAWALAAADVFLDPQLVTAGAWRWHDATPGLPGVPGVPLTDFAGWLLVALVLSAPVQTLAGRGAGGHSDVMPLAMYLWLYLGWIIAFAGFLGLVAAAAWGALAMGLVAVPLGWRLVADVRC